MRLGWNVSGLRFVAVCGFIKRLLRSVLESAGLEVHIPNEHTIGVQPLLGVGLGGVPLLVRPSDVESAGKLLERDNK